MKTKAYILEGYYNYEGSDIIGVFSTKGRAENAQKRNVYIKDHWYDQVFIHVMNMNQIYIK